MTCSRVVIGIPMEPKATGAVLAIRARAQACRGLKRSCTRIAAVIATGAPKPATPSRNDPKANAIRITWIRGSGAIAARLSRRASKCPRCTVSW